MRSKEIDASSRGPIDIPLERWQQQGGKNARKENIALTNLYRNSSYPSLEKITE